MLICMQRRHVQPFFYTRFLFETWPVANLSRGVEWETSRINGTAGGLAESLPLV